MKSEGRNGRADEGSSDLQFRFVFYAAASIQIVGNFQLEIDVRKIWHR